MTQNNSKWPLKFSLKFDYYLIGELMESPDKTLTSMVNLPLNSRLLMFLYACVPRIETNAACRGIN
jgi:hypothetical protein